ncbi:MAG: YkgJ family cysteine cluster protein [Euryarchaeota archaeon]|nr:YkgJ family cysteine cluster protein [Euryarchaeota archaeon]
MASRTGFGITAWPFEPTRLRRRSCSTTRYDFVVPCSYTLRGGFHLNRARLANGVQGLALPGLPCVAHGCSKCCYETEMPLTEADIARIEALGHRRDDFCALDDESVPQLRNDEGHCVFLGPTGACGIYDHRPAGCRLYPLVWDRDSGDVTLDDFCPFHDEFPVAPDKRAELVRVLRTIEAEARDRKAQA